MVSAPFDDEREARRAAEGRVERLTMSPMVMPDVTVTLACLPIWPFGPLSTNCIVPPSAKPPASLADRPVAAMEGADDWKISFSPKNCEKPCRRGSTDRSHRPGRQRRWCRWRQIESAPFVKLAVPFEPERGIQRRREASDGRADADRWAAIDRQCAVVEIDIDLRDEIAALVGNRDCRLAGEVEAVGRKQTGIRARQRCRRRKGGVRIRSGH